ncbi:MAG: CBS domain-containing protein [Rhodocyclaceae bacterium]|nr:CBS domain-containing protein [Rhodocyclaceae bacterium]
MQVSEILAVKGQALFTIAPNKTLADAVAVMTGQDVGSLVVFEGGRMVGMLTFREVLKAVQQGGAAWGGMAISGVMVREPMTAGPEMEVDELRRFMVEQHMRYLPVMDGGTLMGVISFHDVAKAVLEEQSFENRMLKAYIRDWPAEEANKG